ncbi:MAG: CotH kinase family protein [Flavobacterium sp.]
MKKIYFFTLLFVSIFGFAQTFSGTAGLISDNGQANDFTANVTGLANPLTPGYGLKQVCMRINHSYDSDLVVQLIAPDGTLVNLFSGVGGAGDNFTNTCLNQSATISINAGSPPFNGTFKPQETIGNFNNGNSGLGQWKLRIYDTYPADAGILINWSVTFGPNAAAPFVFTSSNLPIVTINTAGQTITDSPSIIANMGIIYNGVGVVNNLTDVPTEYNGNVAIEYRGNYSQSLPQKPYALELRDAANAELNVPILGMPLEHDWCLIASYNDKVFMRNTLAYKLATEMGHYATRSQFCEVVVNGSYQGVYVFMETIKRDNNRVDVSRLDPIEISGLDVTGGYILKNDYWDASNSWQLAYHPIDHPDFNVNLVYDYPKPSNIVPEQKTYIQGFINEFETALYGTNYADPLLGYQKYIDLDSFIDYFIVNELARNNDGFKKSSYFHKTKDNLTSTGKLFAGPVWDFDWAWKNINECSIFAATDGSGWAHKINDCNPDVNSPGWYVRLLQDPNFQNRLRCRWDDFRTTILSNTALNTYIDETAAYLNEAQARHFEKWGNLGINTGTPEVDADPATFEGQITKFKNWINSRITWLDNNIPGTSVGCTLGINPLENPTQFRVFPNPTHQSFQVNSSQNEIAELTVYDQLGKVWLYQTKVGLTGQFNTTLWPNGIYFVQIKGANASLETHKLVVLH